MQRTYTQYTRPDGGSYVLEHREDGHERVVDQAHQGLLAWLAAGNQLPTAPWRPAPLEDLKAACKAQVNAVRLELYHGLFAWQGGRFELDSDSRAKMSGMAALAAADALEGPIAWRDHDNALHELAPAQLIALCAAIARYSQDVYQASWDKKAQVDALADAQAVAAYDVRTGWPAQA